MIHKFDFLLLDGGNLVLSDNSNILSKTLLISLSAIVSKEKNISQEWFSTFFNTQFHGLFKNVHNFYP